MKRSDKLIPKVMKGNLARLRRSICKWASKESKVSFPTNLSYCRNDLPIHLAINAYALDFVLEPRLWPQGHRRILAQEVLDLVDALLRTGR